MKNYLTRNLKFTIDYSFQTKGWKIIKTENPSKHCFCYLKKNQFKFQLRTCEELAKLRNQRIRMNNLLNQYIHEQFSVSFFLFYFIYMYIDQERLLETVFYSMIYIFGVMLEAAILQDPKIQSGSCLMQVFELSTVHLIGSQISSQLFGSPVPGSSQPLAYRLRNPRLLSSANLLIKYYFYIIEM